MRGIVALVAVSFAFGCHHHSTGNSVIDGNPGDVCTPACTGGTVCRYQTCVPPPAPCTQNTDCQGDTYCDTSRSECLPWGVGPGGGSDPMCTRTPVPGVFFPGLQCAWSGPPAGDPYPDHKNVLATPMVALLYKGSELANPSIVFTSYNFTDGGAQSCQGTDPSYFGVLRIIDGLTCAQQATIASPTLIASASVAIGDLDGDGEPEIVAARTGGGLVAFTLKASGWQVLWQTTSTFGSALCDWGGPSLYDLDDDGVPEVLFYGNVYDNKGNALDESLGAAGAYGVGTLPVAADLDGDGTVELVTTNEIYSWDKTAKKWQPKQAISGPGAGFVAVADFGTYTNGQNDRAHKDGIAEVAIISAGTAYVYALDGRQVFTAPLQASGGGPVGAGGPPTIADFDGDGRVEFASAGATAYTVFDPDCTGTPDPTTCPSMTTNGVLWSDTSQDKSSNVTGSSVFDFDGDGRAEVVYGDECFTRVYDGVTGKVLYSRYRTSCTWFENPVIADVDSDYNAEIVSTSNDNCAVTCPAVDPIFDGVQCHDDTDCPKTTHCGREQPGDALGRCRCTQDSDCGGDGFVCLDPIAGPSAAGKVCRASHPAGTAEQGVRVLADTLGRWVNTRGIWNQHAYSVTNINDDGTVPRTSQWLQNWKQPGLNNFRQNTPGNGETANEIPDLTVRAAKVTCGTAGGPTVTTEVCDRGTEPVAPGVSVSVYAAGATTPACQATTTQRLDPGTCTTVSCTWTAGNVDGKVVVDDQGDGTGHVFECREDNNTATFTVACP